MSEEVPLLEGSARFSKYRRVRLFDSEKLSNLEREVYSLGDAWGQWSDELLQSTAVVRKLDWDTRLLGHPCFRLAALHYNTDIGVAEFVEQLSVSLNDCEIHAEVDCEDSTLLQALQQRGFRLIDTKLTYLLTKQDDFAPPTRQRYGLRLMESTDKAAVISLARERFPTMQARFFADQDLHPEMALKLYLEWLEAALADDSDYRIRVVTDDEDIVGFNCYKIIEDVKAATGISIFGRGLAAVDRLHRSAYVDLLAQSIQADFELADAAEFETSMQNFGAHRVFEKLGFKLIRAAYSLKRSVGLT